MAKTAIINIEGIILPEDYIWWEQATSLYRVKQQVQNQPDFDRIRMDICSPGGYCSEGWKIVDWVYSLGVPVDTLAYGQCASFGTVLHQMGETREITPYCDYMVHRPWDVAWGNDLQIAKFNSLLSKETKKLFNFYAKQTGRDYAEIDGLVREDDLFLSPEEAVENGFATAVHLYGTMASGGSKPTIRPGFNAPLDPSKKQTPVYMLSLGDRKINPDAPKDPEFTNNPQNTMTKTAKPLNAAEKSLLDVVSGADPKALDVALTDGRTMVTDSTGDAPVVGDTATIDDATPANGDYPTDKFGTITITDGAISNIAEDSGESTSTDPTATADADENAPATPEQVAALRRENKALKAQNAAQATKLANIEKRVKAVLGSYSSQEPTMQANRNPQEGKGGKVATKSDEEISREDMHARHKAKFVKPKADK